MTTGTHLYELKGPGPVFMPRCIVLKEWHYEEASFFWVLQAKESDN